MTHSAAEAQQAQPSPESPSGQRSAPNRRSLGPWRWAVAMAAVAVIAGVAYLAWTNRALLAGDQEQAQAAPKEPEMSPQLRALVERAQASPEDADAWAELGRAQIVVRRFAEAAEALGKATRLREGDAQLWVDHASAAGAAQGERMSGAPEASVQRALALDPKHPNALAMAGLAASERGDAAAATRYWKQALDVAPAGSPLVESLQLALTAAAAGAGVQEAGAPSSHAVEPLLVVDLSVDKSVKDKVKPGDALFLEVRLADRPGVLVAMARRTVVDSGAMELSLDDSHSVDESYRLSSAEPVVVHARISRAGLGMPEPGDLIGESRATPAKGRTSVSIDKVRR